MAGLFVFFLIFICFPAWMKLKTEMKKKTKKVGAGSAHFPPA